MLLPPDVRDWLPEGHLAWFVIEAVEQLDLSRLLADYRSDGWGRAAHDPQMMVALTLYSYAIGVRSSRKIERRCVEDVAFRVICANSRPDHATIARFVGRHEDALAELFGGVLALCGQAGLGSVGTVAVDSTKLAANASPLQTRGYESIAREILEEAKAIDAAEDELFGDARGDELPPELRTREGRRRRLQEAKQRLDAERAQRDAEEQAKLIERKERHQHYRDQGHGIPGRRVKPAADKKTAPKALRVNVTDPDSKLVKAPRGFIQGYPAQAVVSDDHLIIAAEIADEAIDSRQLQPMIEHARSELQAAGIKAQIETVLADAGYFNSTQITALEHSGTEVLVAVRSDSGRKRRAQDRGLLPAPPKPRPGTVREQMATTLADEETRHRYRRRGALVEPIFGQIKFNRGCDRFSRRGRPAARCEWRLLATTHNLLRLWTEVTGSRALQPAPA